MPERAALRIKFGFAPFVVPSPFLKRYSADAYWYGSSRTGIKSVVMILQGAVTLDL